MTSPEDYMKAMSIGVDEWIKRLYDHRYTLSSVKTTSGYKAMKALEAAVRVPPPPPARRLLQNVIFATDNVEQVLDAPTHYAIVFSADPNPGLSKWQNAEYIQRVKDQHRPWLGTWCDCDKTLPPRAIKLMNDWGLNDWVGQAESDRQFNVAVAAGATKIVGNAGDLSAANITLATKLANENLLSFSQECYTNEGGPWPKDSSSLGIPAHSLTIGIYRTPVAYYSMSDYFAHRIRSNGSDALAGLCVYHSGDHPGELQQLP